MIASAWFPLGAGTACTKHPALQRTSDAAGEPRHRWASLEAASNIQSFKEHPKRQTRAKAMGRGGRGERGVADGHALRAPQASG
jgi:hypothetical protein